MIDDGTGLRERVREHLSLLESMNGPDRRNWSIAGRLLEELAALSAVAPPPVLEGVPVGAVYRHARHSPMATLNPSPEDVALFQRDNPAWAFDHYLYAASPAAPAQAQRGALCSDCPPASHPNSLTRCTPCPRRTEQAPAQPEGGEAVLVMRECMRCGLSHPAEDRAWSDAVAKHLGDTGYGPPFTDVLQNVEACIRATVRLWTKDAARPAHAQHAVTDTPVAWSLDGFIHDEDGRAIGTDETQIHWGSENPDPEAGWQPLYDRPAASLQVTDEMVERALAARYDDGSVRDWFVWADFADHDCDSIIRAALTAALASNAAASAVDAQEGK